MKKDRPKIPYVDLARQHAPLKRELLAAVEQVLDHGHWAGMTLYPVSKCSPARAVDILDQYGGERLWMNSACDWGESVPLAIPRTALEMRRRGWDAAAIDRVIYGNPVRFLSQTPKFTIR